MDPDEYRRFPHLYDAMLGVRPWLRHFRSASTLNQLIAIGFAIYLAFAASWSSALGYGAIFLVAVLVLTAITSATRANINAMIAGSTVVLIALNAGLIWWFLPD